VLFELGASLEREAVRHGHYPDERSAAKGIEPDGVADATYHDRTFLFEGTENFGAEGLTKNLLIQINADGSVAEQIKLPDVVNQQHRSNGFEEVMTDPQGAQVYVAFQREWADDPAGFVKIGRYTPAKQSWAFYHYPLDAAPADSWVGLSEITRLGDDALLVVERDNQQRDQAQVKRLYRVSVADITPTQAGSPLPTLTKTLVRDLLTEDDYRLERIEGAAVMESGQLLIVNDNDGAGETPAAVTRWRTRPLAIVYRCRRRPSLPKRLWASRVSGSQSTKT
jgi:hypothetical protein